MDRDMRRQIRDRAAGRCEYCHAAEDDDLLPFQVDHIIAEYHGGATTLDNLAWSCFDCNVYKGTNLSGVDPQTRAIETLVNPRIDLWSEHFEWVGPLLVGRTARGRATVATLRINLPARVEHRRLLLLVRQAEPDA